MIIAVLKSTLFQQCIDSSKSTMDNVPKFVEIYSKDGVSHYLAKDAIGNYTLKGPFHLNGLPIYKHNCLDLYFYYDLISNGFCISYDPTINNCILIFDIYGDLASLVWDTDRNEYIPSLQMNYRFFSEEPDLQDALSNIPKRIQITSGGPLGQTVIIQITYKCIYYIKWYIAAFLNLNMQN